MNSSVAIYFVHYYFSHYSKENEIFFCIKEMKIRHLGNFVVKNTGKKAKTLFFLHWAYSSSDN